MNTYQILEDRLIIFASDTISFSSTIKQSFTGIHLGKQMIRSSTSACLNYGEAQCAESSRDFVHKLKVSLKELKETSMSFKILKVSKLGSEIIIDKLLDENLQLIAIFLKSIQTANKNSKERKR